MRGFTSVQFTWSCGRAFYLQPCSALYAVMRQKQQLLHDETLTLSPAAAGGGGPAQPVPELLPAAAADAAAARARTRSAAAAPPLPALPHRGPGHACAAAVRAAASLLSLANPIKLPRFPIVDLDSVQVQWTLLRRSCAHCAPCSPLPLANPPPRCPCGVALSRPACEPEWGLAGDARALLTGRRRIVDARRTPEQRPAGVGHQGGLLGFGQ
jgi:hypothetical protein